MNDNQDIENLSDNESTSSDEEYDPIINLLLQRQIFGMMDLFNSGNGEIIEIDDNDQIVSNNSCRIEEIYDNQNESPQFHTCKIEEPDDNITSSEEAHTTDSDTSIIEEIGGLDLVDPHE